MERTMKLLFGKALLNSNCVSLKWGSFSLQPTYLYISIYRSQTFCVFVYLHICISVQLYISIPSIQYLRYPLSLKDFKDLGLQRPGIKCPSGHKKMCILLLASSVHFQRSCMTLSVRSSGRGSHLQCLSSATR